jgi:hypothetical protein
VKGSAILLCLALLVTSACQSLSEKREATLLQDTLRQYEATVRWGDLSQAQGFASDGAEVAAQQLRPDLRITSYQVVQGPSLLDRHRAVQAVAIEYVYESTQQVRELMDQQVWRYDPQAQSWSRQSPFPEFN